MYKKILLTVLAVVVLAGCGAGYEDDVVEDMVDYAPDDTLNLNYALAHAHNRRQVINRPTNAYVAEFSAGYRRGREVDLTDLLRPGPRRTTLTRAEAVEDAYFLFNLLRDVYGGYYYFGGDGVFRPLLDQVVEEILDTDILTPNIFEGILRRHLRTVIQDNHFIFGREALGIHTPMLSSAVYFDRAEDAGDGLDLQLALLEDGRFVYKVVMPGADDVLEKEFAGIPLAVHRPVDSLSRAPELAIHDGVPVVNLRMMVSPLSAEGQTFLSFVDDIADAPVIILDLRNNGGGSHLVGTMWINRLLGYSVMPTFNFVGRGSHVIWGWDLEHFGEDEGDYLLHYLEHFATENIVSDPLIIVLTNRRIYSSGEWFVSQFFNIENTLIVGQNTAGALITDLAAPVIFLPHSGVHLHFGYNQYVYPPGHFAEGVGFTPDVWVNGCALTAVLNMLQKLP